MSECVVYRLDIKALTVGLKALVAHLHRQTAQNVSVCRDVLTWFGSADQRDTDRLEDLLAKQRKL